MNIREQAFKVIQKDPELWRQWHECLDEWDRTNMLVEQAYLLGTKQARKSKAKATSKDSSEVRNLISMGR